MSSTLHICGTHVESVGNLLPAWHSALPAPRDACKAFLASLGNLWNALGTYSTIRESFWILQRTMTLACPVAALAYSAPSQLSSLT